MYLTMLIGPSELTWCLLRGRDEVVDRGRSDQPVAAVLERCMHPEVTAIGLGVDARREAELSRLPALAPPMRACSWYDALIAGALMGQPGVVVSLGAAVHPTGMDGKALAITRDSAHKTRVNAQAEGGLCWIAAEALAMRAQLSGFSARRVHQALDGLGPEDRSAIRSALETLSDYPGPDPACRGLLTKAARRLTDFVTAALARGRIGLPTRAVWCDGALEGPFWEILADHFGKGLPEVRWTPPSHSPEEGLALLLRSEEREIERRNLNPAREGDARFEGRGAFSADAWRQLARLRQ